MKKDRIRWLLPLLVPPIAWAQTSFQRGDVFVGGEGKILRYSSGGQLLQQISRDGVFTGMAFDSSGNLYATDFTGKRVLRFNTTGTFVGTFGSGYDSLPESIVFDGSGNAFVGQATDSAGSSGALLKFNPGGGSIGRYPVQPDERGSDWIELAPDQRTILYTSEGGRILRYDTAGQRQLEDFARVGGNCFALRLLSDGGVLVSHTADVLRLSSAGAVLRRYSIPGSDELFALNLDPDGTSFWTSDIRTGEVYKVNISSGQVLLTLDPVGAGLLPPGDEVVGGIAVFGEITGATPVIISSISPTSVTPGSAAFRLTVNGSGFVANSLVRWNGNALTTPFRTATQLQADVPANLITTAGTATITVLNPGPPAVTSPPFPFTVGGALRENPIIRLPDGDSGVSADRKRIEIFNPSANTQTITGSVSLAFAHNALNPVADDPDVRFSGGGKTASFEIRPGQSLTLNVETGTVAGTITQRIMTLSAGSTPVNPVPDVRGAVRVDRAAPKITNLAFVQRASGFDVCVSGYSNPREITSATFAFTASGQGSLQTTQAAADAASVSNFTNYYRGQGSSQSGSKFLYAQSFSVSGQQNAIGSVAVTLRNSVGPSAEETRPFTAFVSSCN